MEGGEVVLEGVPDQDRVPVDMLEQLGPRGRPPVEHQAMGACHRQPGGRDAVNLRAPVDHWLLRLDEGVDDQLACEEVDGCQRDELARSALHAHHLAVKSHGFAGVAGWIVLGQGQVLAVRRLSQPTRPSLISIPASSL